MLCSDDDTSYLEMVFGTHSGKTVNAFLKSR